MAAGRRPRLSAVMPRVYAPHFLWIHTCNPQRTGYNRGMKRQMIDEEKAARLRVMAFGLVYPGVVLLGIAIEKIHLEPESDRAA